MKQNLYSVLRAGFPADLDATAVETAQGQRYRWRDLEQGSARLANFLDSLGLSPDARVAVQAEKSVEYLLLYLATVRAGRVFLPLNTAYKPGEITYFLGDAQPEVFVCSPANLHWVDGIASKAGVRHVLTLDDNRTGSLLELSTEFSDQHTAAPCGPQDLAAILYTSGTTGRSKGAMLSHVNLATNAQTLKDYWGWQPNDVLIHALPVFHVHGLFVAIHAALLNGSKMLWQSKFDPRQVIERMSDATVFMGVPTLYVRMLAEPTLTHARAQAMRLFISGSAPLLIETFEAWRERTGHTILERYGMSETVMLTSNPYTDDPRYSGHSERRGGTVGFPLPGVELRIRGSDGEALADGEIGGVEVKGPNVFKGYWRMPEKTREEFTEDGFFKTGDLGQIDAQGYVVLVGRSKDLIISGGYNVYPAEVEGILNELEGVAESALIGVPHPDFGEVGFAIVVASQGAELTGDALIEALKKRLANFKIPKRCFIVDALPRNTMGKVQKNLLRDQYRESFS